MVAATQYPESVIIKGLAHIPIPAFHRTWGGVILRFGMAIGLVAGLYLLFHYGLEPYMPAVDDYIRNLGAWGPVLFMLAVILGATLGFPESVLALAAGAVFGIWWGFLWISIAGVIAAFLMFWIGRHLLRSKVDAYLKRHPTFTTELHAALLPDCSEPGEIQLLYARIGMHASGFSFDRVYRLRRETCG